VCTVQAPQLPGHVRLEAYVDTEGGRSGQLYTIASEVEDGTLLVLLPGVYRARSLFGDCDEMDMDEDQGGLAGNVLCVGLGKVTLYKEDHYHPSSMLVHVVEQAKVCMINVRIEPWCGMGLSTPCVEIDAGGALRLLNCSIGPRTRFSKATVDPTWELGGAETNELVSVGHDGAFCAENTRFGPSTCSAVRLEGHCTVTLHRCTFIGTGRGTKVQRVDRDLGTGPNHPEGRWPAIAVSHAAVLHVNECIFGGNMGHPMQWATKNEQDGTVETGQCVPDPDLRAGGGWGGGGGGGSR
jgi:hypothetical protein